MVHLLEWHIWHRHCFKDTSTFGGFLMEFAEQHENILVYNHS